MDDRVTDVAAAVESAVDSIVSVLDAARLSHSPAIPPAQLRVLTIIAGNRHTNMSRLAEALDVVPSSASRLCDRLEATGLLRRVPDPRDRREVRLLLTAASKRLLEHLRERRRDALAEVLGRMPAPAQQELVRALEAFAEAAGDDRTGADDGLRTA
ncbi:MarR family winged helix-turn-helix transcriptional regulator [Paractinoplanes rishiriensis]|uniref:MarR-family transcriptional regulator n=1 Tax=Paractinoplanes rishiriensis TaxID=1050105 RepID=A0A919JXN1_9ACTN|nr:MarR family transcriptional regulator [Actinoplanes rishiriensis]GIE92846.1 putative MarR-family transcriptional regulator [Actinoplanes rishiriensis]